MRSRTLLLVALGLWAAAFVWSYLQLWVTEPTGDGFTRGLNRVTALFGWQLVAAAMAIGIWFAGRKQPGVNRWLTRAPLLLAAVLPVGMLVLTIYANSGLRTGGASVSPDRPVSAPAADGVILPKPE